MKSAAVSVPSALAAKVHATSVNGINRKKNGRAKDATVKDESGLSDSSFSQKKSKPKRKKPARKKAKIMKEEDDDPFSEDDTPLATPKKAKLKAVNGKAKAKAKIKSESDGDVEMDEDDPPRKQDKGKGKASAKRKKDEDGAGKATKKKKKEEEEEVFRWWDAPADVTGDGSVKWKTLEHNGVLFPPQYQPLPKGVKMHYEGACFRDSEDAFSSFYPGKSVDLPPESEEVAGFYAAMLNTDHAENATFKKNFFDDFKLVLKDFPPVRAICYAAHAVDQSCHLFRGMAPRSLILRAATSQPCSTTTRPRKRSGRR